jgi:hypothetical protein
MSAVAITLIIWLYFCGLIATVYVMGQPDCRGYRNLTRAIAILVWPGFWVVVFVLGAFDAMRTRNV